MKNNRKIHSNAMVEEHPLSSNEQKTHSLYSTMSDSYMLGLPVRVLGSIVEASVGALGCTVRAPVKPVGFIIRAYCTIFRCRVT